MADHISYAFYNGVARIVVGHYAFAKQNVPYPAILRSVSFYRGIRKNAGRAGTHPIAKAGAKWRRKHRIFETRATEPPDIVVDKIASQEALRYQVNIIVAFKNVVVITLDGPTIDLARFFNEGPTVLYVEHDFIRQGNIGFQRPPEEKK